MRVLEARELRAPRPTVLIVDDDEGILALVRELLEEAGYACAVAHDGVEALEVVERARPSLVLLDIQMPRMDGSTFAGALRRRLRVPIVVMTGLARPEREADRCNARAVLRKPFDASELVSLVRRFA